MSNSDIQVAKEYHEATKHSEVSVRSSARLLDLENRPKAFKIYTSLPQKPLPHDFPLPSLNAIECVGRLEAAMGGEQLSVGSLASILFFAAGITRISRYAYAKYYMRAASATGALYPIELYVVSKSLGDAEAGVYHFGPGDFVLTQLRRGDFRKHNEPKTRRVGCCECCPSWRPPHTIEFIFTDRNSPSQAPYGWV